MFLSLSLFEKETKLLKRNHIKVKVVTKIYMVFLFSHRLSPAKLFHYQSGRRDHGHVLCHECFVSCHWLLLHLHYSPCHCLELPSPRRCFLYHCLIQTQRYLWMQLKALFWPQRQGREATVTPVKNTAPTT